MPTCWIIAGPNGAGKTTFAMEYLPQVPELVFEQHGELRNVVHPIYYQILLQEAAP